MTATLPKTLAETLTRVAEKPEGLREEYAYYFVREMFRNASEEAIIRWAEGILARTGR